MKIENESKCQMACVAVRKSASENLQWWESLPAAERKLICSLMRMLRGAKRSQLRDVAVAADKWERGIGCFIKVRLMNRTNRNGKRRKNINPDTKSNRRGICITVESAKKNG